MLFTSFQMAKRKRSMALRISCKIRRRSRRRRSSQLERMVSYPKSSLLNLQSKTRRQLQRQRQEAKVAMLGRNPLVLLQHSKDLALLRRLKASPPILVVFLLISGKLCLRNSSGYLEQAALLRQMLTMMTLEM